MFSPADSRHRWYREFEALRDVNLSIRKGETVGIVGRNGSGKSTLLQLICGTLSPSTGSVHVNGRIAALLELGSGFNPEFTGRENVYLNGTVLGLSHEEIDARFAEIVAFADIGDFIEQPVKSYSSGMAVRLAFAVAINVTPDILVVDEALSVGDEAFQRKCFARIEEIRNAGATVLFVSHSAGAVMELCDRAVLLDHGELLLDGTPKYVLSRYHKLAYAPAAKLDQVRQQLREEMRAPEMPRAELEMRSDDAPPADDAYFDQGLRPQSTVRYEQRGASIVDPHVETPDGRTVNVLRPDEEYVYTYKVDFQRAAVAVRLGMLIKTVSGLELGGAVTAPQGGSELAVTAGQHVEVRFHFRTALAPGVYFMNAGVSAHGEEGEIYLDRLIDAIMFRVMPDEGRVATGWVNFGVRPKLRLLERDELSV
ncbi:teichoic acid export ATP-binding protein TagH [Aerosticca soli]|uniref:Teichoic acid export ATP-binding protein TagH n=2 Tax=Aerosticca soli TaxID=2010829 RepID=A0A2Z6E1V0_9GAMM|nr:teichoic acid export ATP-binding protein TagH [Aerosticca soli]